MDKFIIKLRGKTESYKHCVIDIATHEKLSRLKEKTGISMAKIIAQMVDFCLERMEVQED